MLKQFCIIAFVHNENTYRVALSLVDGIGPVNTRLLLHQFNTATQIFEAAQKSLNAFPRDIQKALKMVSKLPSTVYKTIAEELKFVEKEGIQLLYPGVKNYPSYLTNCPDAPMLLYFKGTGDLNVRRKVAIVGTRRSTDYGRHFTEKLVEELAACDCTIISGLAYGIDITAHKAALKHNLPNFAVMGTGLDRVYPATHHKVAQQLLQKGGLLTEYMTGTDPNPENFPSRNRIVAGICDCIIVVESGIKGGSMLTAEIASTYNRDVFAVPGRVNDENSSGCNLLIKNNKAALIESGKDVALFMGWDAAGAAKLPSAIQIQLFNDLPEDEKIVADLLKTREQFQIDELIVLLNAFTPGYLAGLLLNLELKGIIRSLPGKVYKLN